MLDALAQVAAHHANRPISRLTVAAWMATTEAIGLGLALWFAAYWKTPGDAFDPILAGLVAGLAAVLSTALFLSIGAYRPGTLLRLRTSLGYGMVAVSVAVFLAAIFGISGLPLAVWFGTAVLVAGPVIGLLRVIARAFIGWAKTFGALERRAIIAGGGERAERLIRALANTPGNDIRVVALFDDRDDSRSDAQVLGVPKLGGYWDTLRFVALAEVDLVLITLPLEAEARITWLLSTFKALPQRIHLVDFSSDLSFEKAGGIGLLMVRESSFDTVRKWQKRAFDVVFGSLALIIAAPIMVLAALAIRLETKGPIFFTQYRHGFSNREVPVLKFRSMYHDMADVDGTNVVKRGGDPRVTKVGAVLRKTSIDELPQLICVLKGDLSLVGPRPHAVDARSSAKEPFESLVHDYAARHRLPPGITGWAQINGLRGGIDAADELRERVAHDLHYIENWSIWFDIKILLSTPRALFKTDKAY